MPKELKDFPAGLAQEELQFPDIRPGDGKQIVWAGAAGVKTPLAVVYLHGFSAGPQEIRPVPDAVARALGANLFFTRLTGHGRTGGAMAEATAGDWLRDTAEAMAIGRRLGDRVLVLSTSTGGTLAAIAAADPALSRDMAGVVMISPNFGLRPWSARLLDLPLVQLWGPWVAGRTLGFTPSNAAHAAHWTTSYPTQAVFPMAALVAHARGLDYRAVRLPLLVQLSPEDQVVDPARTRALVAGWGGPVRLEERHMGPGDDPYSHVLAGDILSPGQTGPVVALILDWARGAVMAEPLVMIPGLMADARLFLPQMVALGAGRALQVCLPARGETVEQMSEAILPGLPDRFALLGHGLGGDVALDLIRRIPDRITRVALMATDPLAEPPAAAAAREARMVAARAGRLTQAMREEIPPAALAETPWRDEVLALVQDMALGLGEGVFLRQSRALQRRPDQQKTMRRVKLPALVLAGEADTLVPLRRQEFTANLMPFGRLQVIAEAGHLAPLEQPEAVTAALEAFLNGPVLLR